MPKLDLDAFPLSNMTRYPAAFAPPLAGRWHRRLGPDAGLADFGVSHVTLEPGAWSGQRHWHEGEDEFVVMLAGEAVLIDDTGRHALRPGDCAAFPKGDRNAHHIVNETDAPCTFVAIGRVLASPCHYPDIDMHYKDGCFFHKDGTPY